MEWMQSANAKLGRSTYLPAEWGPRTWETTLLDDSATTTRRAGLGCAQKRILRGLG